MSGWGGGYVTDITYMTGYYRQQSPSVIALGACWAGWPRRCLAPTIRCSYLELGCGQGFGALVLAASNPHWKVTAIDFNPAHIAAARDWAAQAGLNNVSFLEADLSTLAEDPAAARCRKRTSSAARPVELGAPGRAVRDRPAAAAKVKPGGAVHVSYNALPAWGGALGMQRVMRDCGGVSARAAIARPRRA